MANWWRISASIWSLRTLKTGMRAAVDLAAELALSADPKALCELLGRQPKATSTAQLRLHYASARSTARRHHAAASNDTTQAVVEALEQAERALSKSDLLEATSFPASQWNGAIKPLLDSDAVTNTGERRGARYSIPLE